MDGWFATGDIAVRDGDGNLWLVGRTTDLVIVNGFNVYPAEVEAVLGRLPGVAEVAVVGEPDPRTGEAVVAYVVRAARRRRWTEEVLRGGRPLAGAVQGAEPGRARRRAAAHRHRQGAEVAARAADRAGRECRWRPRRTCRRSDRRRARGHRRHPRRAATCATTAEADVAALAAELGFRVRVRDLDTDPGDLAARAPADLVPVLLVDGGEHGLLAGGSRDRVARRTGPARPAAASTGL